MVDERITTFFARDTQSPCQGAHHWNQWLERFPQSRACNISPSISMGSTDRWFLQQGRLYRGLTYWQVHETIRLFNAPNAVVVSADVNEIGVQKIHH